MYMAVTTVTTVGFREVNELSDAGRVFTMLYVLTGVGAAFYILTALVAVIIEGDLGEIFGVRRYRVAIRQLENHYIICGYGRVGREVAQELTARKVPFVVVDLNPDVQEQAKRDNVLMINSDATDADVLTEAGHPALPRPHRRLRLGRQQHLHHVDCQEPADRRVRRRPRRHA